MLAQHTLHLWRQPAPSQSTPWKILFAAVLREKCIAGHRTISQQLSLIIFIISYIEVCSLPHWTIIKQMTSTPKYKVASSVLMGPPPLPAPRRIIYNHTFASFNPVPDLPLFDDRNDNKRKIFLSPRMRTVSPSEHKVYTDLAEGDKQQKTAIQKRRPSRRLNQKGCIVSDDLASSLKSSSTSATSVTTNSSFTSSSASLSSSRRVLVKELVLRKRCGWMGPQWEERLLEVLIMMLGMIPVSIVLLMNFWHIGCSMIRRALKVCRK